MGGDFQNVKSAVITEVSGPNLGSEVFGMTIQINEAKKEKILFEHTFKLGATVWYVKEKNAPWRIQQGQHEWKLTRFLSSAEASSIMAANAAAKKAAAALPKVSHTGITSKVINPNENENAAAGAGAAVGSKAGGSALTAKASASPALLAPAGSKAGALAKAKAMPMPGMMPVPGLN